MIQTDIDFPRSLPCPLRIERPVSHERTFLRSSMRSGRSRQRRLFTSVPSMQSVVWYFTDMQVMAFEAWYRDSIDDGAAWFNCLLRTPVGLKPYVCRFASEYRGPEPIGYDRWRVATTLELWERPLLERGWGHMPDFVAGMDIFDIALNREWPKA